MKRRPILAIAGIGLALSLALVMIIDADPVGMFSGRLAAPSAVLSQFNTDQLDDAEKGAIYFAFGDFSALGSEALELSAAPWKLSTALLALRRSGGDLTSVNSEAVVRIFQDFGFVSPTRIANWPADLPEPNLNAPLGQNLGFANRLLPPLGVTVSNVSCAACHAGVVYDAEGQPDPSTVWLGTPNASINLERYITELYAAMRDRPTDDALIWAAVDKLYPDTDWREWLALRTIVLPRVDSLVASQEMTIHRLLPFQVSTMGSTNGLQALQVRFGILPNDQLSDPNVPISVPELGGRIWRSSLLASGAYGVPGEVPQRPIGINDLDDQHISALAGLTAFFTVPSMGISPATAASHVEDADNIFDWLKTYRPQPFPGAVNKTAARRGQAIYSNACASCHGSYDDSIDQPKLQEFPNWQGNVGTDRAYLKAFDQATVDMVNGLGYDSLLKARLAPDYVAQPLAGLWSSAPYLHNGSVPTLWHLMHPDQRPAAFDVGGHRLDFAKVGIAGQQRGTVWASPPGYVSWASPERIDTTIPGLGAGGHEQSFDTMSEDDKSDLLEYLKLL